MSPNNIKCELPHNATELSEFDGNNHAVGVIFNMQN